MKVVMTVEEAIDRYHWDEVSEMVGINSFALTVSFMREDEEITLTEEQAHRSDLLPLKN